MFLQGDYNNNYNHNSAGSHSVVKYILSVKSQKGINTVQICSVENQKGVITVQCLWHSNSALLVFNGTIIER